MNSLKQSLFLGICLSIGVSGSAFAQTTLGGSESKPGLGAPLGETPPAPVRPMAAPSAAPKAPKAPAPMPQAAAASNKVEAAEPQSIVDALQALGYRAQLGTDDNGDPQIQSTIDGSNYTIWFYGCDQGAACTDITFSIAFDMPNGTDLETVNLWNRERIMGRAYLDDENDPYLDHFIVTVGGIERETFDQIVANWSTTVADFKDRIGF
ncbi:YbjN domain-containing protein [Fulvimarina manganoxydans]|uniref:YbjN domain-containing protein n=1 Tax=Fulvimarina manganoxydans TaxID=937218 RepID=UPI002356010C|nr:YbjN domain-containing protein [Fulvimarina manganoxydans]